MTYDPIEVRKHFFCADCGFDTWHDEYYMVLDSIWDVFGVKGQDKMLCIGCLEKRMGRDLTRNDFTNAPINYWLPKSERLLKRLKNFKCQTN